MNITDKCDSQCTTCDRWKNNIHELSIVDCNKIILEFKAISPFGLVVITGGEPLTNFSKLKCILQLCKNLKLKVKLETNGNSFLDFYRKYYDLCNNSIFCLRLSFNSLDKKLNNISRGMNNSWEIQHKILSEIDRTKIKVWCNAILGDFTLDTFIDTYNYCKKIFDKFSFSLMVKNLWGNNKFEKFNNIDKYIEIIDYLKNNSNSFLTNLSFELEEKKQLIKIGESFTLQRKCLAPLDYIMVQADGSLSLCWNYDNQINTNYNKIIGNMKEINLINLYDITNTSFNKYREQLYTNCNKWCGSQECHLPITL